MLEGPTIWRGKGGGINWLAYLPHTPLPLSKFLWMIEMDIRSSLKHIPIFKPNFIFVIFPKEGNVNCHLRTSLNYLTIFGRMKIFFEGSLLWISLLRKIHKVIGFFLYFMSHKSVNRLVLLLLGYFRHETTCTFFFAH